MELAAIIPNLCFSHIYSEERNAGIRAFKWLASFHVRLALSEHFSALAVQFDPPRVKADQQVLHCCRKPLVTELLRTLTRRRLIIPSS